MSLSVDLIPDSGVQMGGYNPRETNLLRVRSILSMFVPGRLDAIFFFVDLQDQAAVNWLAKLCADFERKAPQTMKILLTVLKDGEGGLNPETAERQASFAALRKVLGIGPKDAITRDALQRAGVLHKETGCFPPPGVKMYAATGNHSSYAARLWKRGTEWRDNLNPQLNHNIKVENWDDNQAIDRRDLCRSASVYILNPGPEEEEKKSRLRQLAVMENCLEDLFVAGKQTFAAALLAMRNALEGTKETIKSRMTAWANDHPSDKAAKAFLKNGKIPWSSGSVQIPFDASNPGLVGTISAVLRTTLSHAVERPSKRESIAGGRQPGVINLVMASQENFNILYEFVRQYEEDTLWDFAVTQAEATSSKKARTTTKDPSVSNDQLGLLDFRFLCLYVFDASTVFLVTGRVFVSPASCPQTEKTVDKTFETSCLQNLWSLPMSQITHLLQMATAG